MKFLKRAEKGLLNLGDYLLPSIQNHDIIACQIRLGELRGNLLCLNDISSKCTKMFQNL